MSQSNAFNIENHRLAILWIGDAKYIIAAETVLARQLVLRLPTLNR